ncbi:GtrA family protein [Novacetimonas hansenii]|uniref:GtrA family protein n=1 Tax=Novacetimonas hansenii TaxID=436 RepID=UPI0007980592|nr:GtrA family protein [Novacetimonas hansenii]WEQ60103.1 GtrA family protein [Novacetimonas hansenii]CUW46559.1 GtrA-like protein [Novacetimonas hansenii]
MRKRTDCTATHDSGRAPIFQFLRFGIVGALGLGWDTAAVYALRPLVGLGCAAIIAYFVAASSNWWCNRLWTFRNRGNRHHFLHQWARFMAGNTVGFCLNRGCVFVLFHLSATCRLYPVLALAAGALSGMTANFHISRKHVFQHARPDMTPPVASGTSSGDRPATMEPNGVPHLLGEKDKSP